MLLRTVYGLSGFSAVVIAAMQIIVFCTQLHTMTADPLWQKNSIFALLLLTLAAGLFCLHHALADRQPGDRPR